MVSYKVTERPVTTGQVVSGRLCKVGQASVPEGYQGRHNVEAVSWEVTKPLTLGQLVSRRLRSALHSMP